MLYKKVVLYLTEEDGTLLEQVVLKVPPGMNSIATLRYACRKIATHFNRLDHNARPRLNKPRFSPKQKDGGH